jgi:hypothetical protein
MEWQIIVALVITIPVILLPVSIIWYVNVGGVYLAIKEAKAKRAAREADKARINKEVGERVKILTN